MKEDPEELDLEVEVDVSRKQIVTNYLLAVMSVNDCKRYTKNEASTSSQLMVMTAIYIYIDHELIVVHCIIGWVGRRC